MNIALRPYQVQGIAAVQADVAAGYRRVLIHLPVGAGKTVVFATLAQQWHQPTLVLVHREELLTQAVDKFRMVWPEADLGIVRGAHDEYDAQVVVATVQTLAGRLARATPDRFRLAIADEAHHTTSPQWQQVLRAYGFWPTPAPHHCFVGVTATTTRTDGVDLGVMFEKTSYQLSMLELIQSQYLSDIRAIRVTTHFDLDQVPVDASGDWDAEALGRLVDTPTRNQLVVQSWKTHARKRHTLVFAATVAHAQHLAEAFRKAGVRADWIAGQHKPRERTEKLQAFHRKTTQVLINVAILTEGYDEPSIDCVVLARPTQSAIVYTQAIGRGTRRHPDKRDCLILDLADNSTRHRLCTVGTVVGLPDELLTTMTVAQAAQVPEAERLHWTPRADRDEAPDVAVATTSTRVDLFDQSVFRWQRLGHRYQLAAGPNQWVQLIPTIADPESYDVVVRQGTTKTSTAVALPLDYALGTAEDWVRTHGQPEFADRDAAWRTAPATPEQIARARQWQIPLPPQCTQELAQDLIETAQRERVLQNPKAAWRKAPASPRAKALMDRLGIDYPVDILAGEASTLIEAALGTRARPTASPRGISSQKGLPTSHDSPGRSS